MLELKAKIRSEIGKKVKELRQRNIMPAVLYGPKIKNLNLEINLKDFEKILKKVGESSLVSIKVDPPAGGKKEVKFLALIHDVKRDSLTGLALHADFYQPLLTQEIEVSVPLVFEGEAPAIKDLGGTLVREFHEISVKALPEHLPHEIVINVSGLKSFEDKFFVKDLVLPEGVKINKNLDEIVAKVLPPEKIEEDLKKPIEEKVEEVEKVEKKEKEEPVAEEKEKKV
jgi:large subunit ribosomal protein L25